MSARPIWKHPADVMFRTLDFSKIFPSAVTIAGTPTYSVSPSGALTAVQEGAPAGATTTVKLQAGADGADYVVTCAAVGSNGETYNRAVMVKVRTGL